ncbi:MAG: sodium:proton antiporter [Coriobacteriales bacterium]|jgi:Na+/H+ antiporter NhaD/arsenite permease-like protein|nr:sodium:proton antiporter [Coriobacteriales bacterium]
MARRKRKPDADPIINKPLSEDYVRQGSYSWVEPHHERWQLLIKIAISALGLVLLALPALLELLGGGGAGSGPGAASEAGTAGPHSGELPLFFLIPFAGMLLSIALFPLFKPHWWEKNLFFVAVFWALAFLLPFACFFGPYLAGAEFFEIVLLDYLPFVVLLWGLFVVTGGIVVRSSIQATPGVNLALLLISTALASWMGTTGASMLFIRIVLRANAWRKQRAHVIIFFIFLVANIGGSLTPIGDPPLFLGFLRGVPFFWTLELLPMMLLNTAVLLGVFYLIDRRMYARELAAGRRPAPRHKAAAGRGGAGGGRGGRDAGGADGGAAGAGDRIVTARAGAADSGGGRAAAKAGAADGGRRAAAGAGGGDHTGNSKRRIQFAGLHNLVFLAMIVGAVILSGMMGTMDALKDPATGEIYGLPFLYGIQLPLNNAVQMAIILISGVLAWLTTKKQYHELNEFGWEPIKEVAALFIGIFVTMIPALELLHSYGPNLGLSEAWQFFWATGLLSSFLDNAPTYLVFLTTATTLGFEGVVTSLGPISNQLLLAVSTGAVFMGANTYIGNAPNFMVRSIAEKHHVKMPSFFGYIGWSAAILLPLFLLDTLIFFVF